MPNKSHRGEQNRISMQATILKTDFPSVSLCCVSVHIQVWISCLLTNTIFIYNSKRFLMLHAANSVADWKHYLAENSPSLQTSWDVLWVSFVFIAVITDGNHFQTWKGQEGDQGSQDGDLKWGDHV